MQPFYEDAFLKSLLPIHGYKEFDAQNFEKKLIEGIQKGSVVISKEGKIIGMETTGIDPQALSLCRNRAYVIQEARKLQAMVSVKTYDAFLTLICEKRGLTVPSTTTIAACQKEAVLKLSDEKLLLTTDFSLIIKAVEACKNNGALEACGIPQNERPDILSQFDSFTLKNIILQAVKRFVINEVSEEKTFVGLTPFFRKFLKEYANFLTDKALEKIKNETTALEFIQKLREPFKSSDSLWPSLLNFLSKWHHACVTDSRPGFDDIGEVLGDGICHALSLRWAIEEMKGIPVDMKATYSKDRYLQAFYIVSQEKRSISTKKISKLLNIQTVKISTFSLDESLNAKQEITKTLSNFMAKNEVQKTFKGVTEMCYNASGTEPGHAICVCCRELETPPIYRFHDQNFGTFTFSSKEKLFDCLSDLFTLYRKNINQITFNCCLI